MNRSNQCACGDVHASGVTPAIIGRMKAYLYAYPDRQFAVDEDAGIVAVIVPRACRGPEVLAHSHALADLLDQIGAPTPGDLS